MIRAVAICILLLAACGSDRRAPARLDAADATFTRGSLRLRIEPIRDDLVHFELAPIGATRRPHIETSPMVASADPPIAWAAHGSVNCRTADDAYIAIVDQLLDAGAAREPSFNRWNEPPEELGSDAVADHLRARGFAPED